MPSFADRSVTDICVIVNDIERSISFYRDVIGFQLLHRAPGFADFQSAGVVFALWDKEHINSHTGVDVTPQRPASVLIAVRLENAAEVDTVAADLQQRGVVFSHLPRDCPWNARCAYFAGPDGEVWELYAWLTGGAPGKIGNT